MSARTRALRLNWDVDCVPPEEQNPAGVVIAMLILRDNIEATREREKLRSGLDKLAKAVREK